MATLPWRIEQMAAQLGGLGLHGAFTYTGASGITFKNREDDARPDSSYFDSETGALFFETGLMWKVNVKRGQTWKMVVALDASDTYSVYMLKCYGLKTALKKGRMAEIEATANDIYCDQVQGIVEAIYDDIIQEENGGFIPLY